MTSLPVKREFGSLGFAVVCGPDVHCDGVWVEIANLDQAGFAARASRTGVDALFEAEARGNAGRPAPHRWFLFADVGPTDGPDDRVLGAFVVATPGPGARLRGATTAVSSAYCVGSLLIVDRVRIGSNVLNRISARSFPSSSRYACGGCYFGVG